ncbi:MAG: alpha/beta hydrolase [Myxococcales bacterium]
MPALRPPDRDALEALIVRSLAALPSRAQLMLAGGRPIRIDGQQLDPEVQLTLMLLKLSRRPSVDELPVPEARVETRRKAEVYSGAPLPIAEVRRVEVPGADGPLQARLYIPQADEDPAPLLVYFHGGGWVVGDLDTHDQPCRFLAREARVRVLSVGYRLAPEHPFPAPLEDCLAATRHAIAEAERYGADPGRVAVGGDSAGGNLAAVVARLLTLEEAALAFQLLIYPVTDVSRKRESYRLFRDGFFLTERQMDWYRDHYLPDASAAADPRVSPVLAAGFGGLPPAHVVTAGFDVLRDEGEDYAGLLRDAGVPVTTMRETGLIHGFTHGAVTGRAPRHAMSRIAAALRGALAQSRRPAASRR